MNIRMKMKIRKLVPTVAIGPADLVPTANLCRRCSSWPGVEAPYTDGCRRHKIWPLAPWRITVVHACGWFVVKDQAYVHECKVFTYPFFQIQKSIWVKFLVKYHTCVCEWLSARSSVSGYYIVSFSCERYRVVEWHLSIMILWDLYSQ
jgi:hypothetical protein